HRLGQGRRGRSCVEARQQERGRRDGTCRAHRKVAGEGRRSAVAQDETLIDGERRRREGTRRSRNSTQSEFEIVDQARTADACRAEYDERVVAKQVVRNRRREI